EEQFRLVWLSCGQCTRQLLDIAGEHRVGADAVEAWLAKSGRGNRITFRLRPRAEGDLVGDQHAARLIDVSDQGIENVRGEVVVKMSAEQRTFLRREHQPLASTGE